MSENKTFYTRINGIISISNSAWYIVSIGVTGTVSWMQEVRIHLNTFSDTIFSERMLCLVCSYEVCCENVLRNRVDLYDVTSRELRNVTNLRKYSHARR